MEGTNALGDYLRARRELVQPEDVGLSREGMRRVAGLRREEVATLAGMSADYYLRLEQGRDRNPSPQILDALATALRLDADSRAYLFTLAQQVHPDPGAAARQPLPGEEPVPASILALIHGWTLNPAYVQNKFTDLLAVNQLCAALSPCYVPGANLLRAVFLDPSERVLRRDWEEATTEGVASLRMQVGADLGDPRLVSLVAELSERSERFRGLWERHDVQPKRGRVSRLRHPQVGDIDLRSDKLAILGTDLTLVVFHAEPGSRSAELLQILGSLTIAI
jgi:transcriptional regulator with XRE-family HTH domain